MQCYAVIPAFNEERCIARVVAGTRMCLPGIQIVVVDDGSTDHTGAAARGAGAAVIRLPLNSGYGVALQTGLLWAYRHGAEMVVTLDADGQHDPTELSRLMQPLADGTAELVLGSRYLDHGAHYAVPFLRRIGSRLFAALVTHLIHQRITDPTTGFQAMNRDVLRLYATLADFPEKTPDANLIVYASLRHVRISEVPVVMYADQGAGSMHDTLTSAFYVPRMMVSVLGVLLGGWRHREAQ